MCQLICLIPFKDRIDASQCGRIQTFSNSSSLDNCTLNNNILHLEKLLSLKYEHFKKIVRNAASFCHEIWVTEKNFNWNTVHVLALYWCCFTKKTGLLPNWIDVKKMKNNNFRKKFHRIFQKEPWHGCYRVSIHTQQKNCIKQVLTKEVFFEWLNNHRSSIKCIWTSWG